MVEHLNLTNKYFKRANWLKIPTGRRKISWLLISVAEELNPGRRETTPDSGQNGT